MREPRPEKDIQMSATKRKKLYFDFSIGINATRQIFPATQFTSSLTGDRYGGLLDALEACTGSSPADIKRRNEVSAWVQRTAQVYSNTPMATSGQLSVQFVYPTSGNGTGPVVPLPFMTPGFTFTDGKDGSSAVFGVAGTPRHFSIVVRRPSNANIASTVRGVLYVQRQHSIEV
jgi:hypothetical protein